MSDTLRSIGFGRCTHSFSSGPNRREQRCMFCGATRLPGNRFAEDGSIDYPMSREAVLTLQIAMARHEKELDNQSADTLI